MNFKNEELAQEYLGVVDEESRLSVVSNSSIRIDEYFYSAIAGLVYHKRGHWAHQDLLYREYGNYFGTMHDLYLSEEDFVKAMLHVGFSRDYDPLGRPIWRDIGLQSNRKDTDSLLDTSIMDTDFHDVW